MPRTEQQGFENPHPKKKQPGSRIPSPDIEAHPRLWTEMTSDLACPVACLQESPTHDVLHRDGTKLEERGKVVSTWMWCLWGAKEAVPWPQLTFYPLQHVSPIPHQFQAGFPKTKVQCLKG